MTDFKGRLILSEKHESEWCEIVHCALKAMHEVENCTQDANTVRYISAQKDDITSRWADLSRRLQEDRRL